MERNTHLQGLPLHISPWQMSPFQVPQRGPMERKARLKSFLYISWIHRALIDRDAPFTELSFHHHIFL
jgi:hypothetical protein